LENRLNQLQTVEAYIGTFFSKEYVLKKVLRMTDSDIQEMRDQIKKEIELDPMDGGIVVPDGGDGIQRIPVGPDGMPMDPADSAADRADKAMGIDPDAPEEPAGEEEPVEDDKEFHVKKGKK
jgi:hypothetical protein